MDIHYRPQRVTDLQFSVTRHRLVPEQFKVLKSHRIEQECYCVELWIIGSSHALNLWTPHGCLAEVLTCGQVASPSDRNLCHRQGAQNWSWEHHEWRVSYKVDMTTTRLREDEFVLEQTRVLQQRTPGRMLFRFPRVDPLIVSPITLIDIIQSNSDCLEIQTLHSYVEDLTMVWTRSLFQIHT